MLWSCILHGGHGGSADGVVGSSQVVCKLWAEGLHVHDRLRDARAPWTMACRVLINASEVGVHWERPAHKLHPSALLHLSPWSDSARSLEKVMPTVCQGEE
eukprot:2495673-Rhodomonas_salina.1